MGRGNNINKQHTAMSIRIGFDAKRAAQNRTGLGNYSRFVVRILSQHRPGGEYHLFTPNPKRAGFLREIPTLAALYLHCPISTRWKVCRALWRSWGIAADLQRNGINLFHGLSNELPLSIGKAGCRSVVTIHDLIFLRHPEYYKPIDRAIYNFKFRKACLLADRIIAVSEFTKRDIVKYYGIAESKIDVVYQGCDPAFAAPVPDGRLGEVRRQYNLPDRFVLYVGSIEQRKNLMLVAKAFMADSRLKDSGLKVVAVGRHTPYTDEIRHTLSQAGLADSFVFLHSVPFADLPPLYRLATAFVYPSRIEGFGIPMLEAISSGVPAIGCTGSCLEEAGGPGCIYVDPDDAGAMADAIHRTATDADLRRQMTERGRAYALRFSDEKLCADLWEVYMKVL